MGFSNFRIKVFIRVILFTATIAVMTYTLFELEAIFAFFVLFGLLILQLYELFHYLEITNRKLTRFLESIKYSDFVSTFTSDSQLGSSFRDLNVAFNEVLEAFRLTRAEKEAHLHYLHTIVEHVNTGLLAFDTEGNVELINATTKKLLGILSLHNIEELIENNSRLYKAIFDLAPGKSTIYANYKNEQLAIHATELILKGRRVKLLSIQNIQPELQKKELEAWQNLTRVLRHEIMNSITPIASLTSTMKTILDEDLIRRDDHYVLENETMEDLGDGLATIENRSQGLIRFIDAYRDYTAIPLPKMEQLRISDLFRRIKKLLGPELGKNSMSLECSILPEELEIFADEKLIELVLINLIKNAIEANKKGETIHLYAAMRTEKRVQIIVEDHGEGIIREALERIFIPFYTTKKTGSGIGLALSRQIMQLHNGHLSVESEPNEFTRFILHF
jgi:nitrogen fixation/metabolism regulation signal transduction histidine kinase